MEKTFREIIDLFGRKNRLAQMLSVPDQTVSSWYQRDRIPVQYFDEIVKVANENGHQNISHRLLCQISANSKYDWQLKMYYIM